MTAENMFICSPFPTRRLFSTFVLLPFHLQPYVGRFHNENEGKTFLWNAAPRRTSPASGRRKAAPGTAKGRQHPLLAPALQSGPCRWRAPASARKAGGSPRPTLSPSAIAQVHSPWPNSAPSFRPRELLRRQSRTGSLSGDMRQPVKQPGKRREDSDCQGQFPPGPSCPFRTGRRALDRTGKGMPSPRRGWRPSCRSLGWALGVTGWRAS